MMQMTLLTHVEIDSAPFHVLPSDRLLFVGSCFAANIGEKFAQNQFRTLVNPYGVMYNPVSVLHTVQRAVADGTVGEGGVDVAVFTLGTNHVYILNETGEIVDNCRKRPQRLFTERELSVGECAEALQTAIDTLRQLNPQTKVVLTVSPIRYAKYGYHGSRLSKATLLLAADCIIKGTRDTSYFPAYEIMNDELRDYRFYQPDMLHPSPQAVDYIYSRFDDVYFTDVTRAFVREWQPIRAALAHRPFYPDGDEYKRFLADAQEKERQFRLKWKL